MQVISKTEAEALSAPEVQDDFDLRPEEEQALDVKSQPEVRVPDSRVLCVYCWQQQRVQGGF